MKANDVMSVCLYLMRVAQDDNSIDAITEAFLHPLAIGTQVEVETVLFQICPDTFGSDGEYLLPEGNGSVWLIHLSNDEPVTLIYAKPHFGQCELATLEQICNRLKCRIFDPQYGEFIH